MTLRSFICITQLKNQQLKEKMRLYTLYFSNNILYISSLWLSVWLSNLLTFSSSKTCSIVYRICSWVIFSIRSADMPFKIWVRLSLRMNALQFSFWVRWVSFWTCAWLGVDSEIPIESQSKFHKFWIQITVSKCCD